ncbi:MAG TPA: DNA (cytosine-5-)-methyltransferase [Hyphomonadaceae bacterium]|nr:DNA (cytosine-5-)-methyltransferase [Hyphomonadaceae bacterium]
MFSFFEFFAGGGMVRAGLGGDWRCLFANDFDPKKAQSYIANWGDKELHVGDVATIALHDLPKQTPNLIWGSFPCQDLSLAGAGKGLEGARSGSFWPYWRLVEQLVREGRAPGVIVLENVAGTLTSHEGKDFEAIIRAFADIDFDVGAMLVDAQHFVPQSRPRLFFVGVPRAQAPRQLSLLNEEVDRWHPANVKRAYLALPAALQKRWIWWSMPAPPTRNACFVDVIEEEPTGVKWHTKAETKRLLSMMSPVNVEKVEAAKQTGRRMAGGMYRRTRTENGKSVQRVEVRFDDVSGCLRTPAGGSSRQFLLIVEGDTVRSRLISARETARLMGLPDSYKLPENYNDAYHLTGDGVVVNVVKYLAENIIEPQIAVVTANSKKKAAKKKSAAAKAKGKKASAKKSAKKGASKPRKAKKANAAKKPKTGTRTNAPKSVRGRRKAA